MPSSTLHPDAPQALRPLFDRTSCRTFSPEAIPDESLCWLREVMRLSPSGGNCQPWHFFQITNLELRRKLAGAASQPFIAEAPVLFVICADAGLSASRYGQRGSGLYCLQDTAAAVMNLLTASTALGYGTCWIGAFNESEVARILNLPPSLRPVAMVPVGRPKSPPARRTDRKPEGEVFTFLP
jgi:nitroreductase